MGGVGTQKDDTRTWLAEPRAFEEVSACSELASPLGSVLSRILHTKWSKTPTPSVPTVGQAGIGYCVIK